jgi:hypothetical protein
MAQRKRLPESRFMFASRASRRSADRSTDLTLGAGTLAVAEQVDAF